MKNSNRKPWDILSDANDIQLLGENVSLEPLGDILLYIEPELLTVFAYILMTSIRSFLREHETYVESVLCIAGNRGCGQEELTAWTGGIYTQDKEPLGIIPKGSTYKYVSKKLSALKNQPLVVDDRCLKGSEHRRQKKAWDLFKKGLDPSCGAGLILLSDIAPYKFCILVPVIRPLDIPEAFTPELLGAAVRHFLRWMSKHYREFSVEFFSTLGDNEIVVFGEDFTYYPYRCLDLVLKCFLASLKLPKKMQKYICQKLQRASEGNYGYQFNLKKEILTKKKA